MTEHCRIIGDTFYSDRLVRFSHCDPAGIVFYPQYFIMFNGLVEDWFNQGLGVNYARYITEHKLGFPIVSLNCEFSATSTIGEIITLGLKLERLGRSSMEIAVDCRYKQEERLRARFVLVSVDLNHQRAQPVPDDLRGLMQAFQQGQLDINNHRRDS
ncbi:MAG: thioesterase family protein [Rhodocyclaceae bacterium]|nr:acyl-CoA thioesterase [Rhodocyclaceae bacterium]MCO5095923.1 acyl-CoA thioesterase [Rhodocyclaceae bacterium]MCW5594489.1 acyl-CoA thioesterase [Rhodocyclaceae bacterium]